MFFIRSASSRDLQTVSELLRTTWHATYDSLYGVDKVEQLTRAWHSVKALQARLDAKGSEFLVADNGKAIGGMGYAGMSKEKPKTALLHQLYVRPDFQRQGIGKDIFAELETCFPDAETMVLQVEPGNVAAIRFYQGLGFNEIGRTENCGDGQSGIPALVLEKTLDF